MSTTVTIDEARVERFAGLVVQEAGAALNTALVAIGDRLGLYRAMADGRPVSSDELAAATDTHERYVREWLAAQAASGFVEYEPDTGRYALPAEHALVLADDASPVALAGLFQSSHRRVESRTRVEERFRTGARPRLARARRRPLLRHRAHLRQPHTAPSSSRRGSRRSTASSTGSSGAPASPTSAAATASRPS